MELDDPSHLSFPQRGRTQPLYDWRETLNRLLPSTGSDTYTSGLFFDVRSLFVWAGENLDGAAVQLLLETRGDTELASSATRLQQISRRWHHRFRVLGWSSVWAAMHQTTQDASMQGSEDPGISLDTPLPIVMLIDKPDDDINLWSKDDTFPGSNNDPSRILSTPDLSAANDPFPGSAKNLRRLPCRPDLFANDPFHPPHPKGRCDILSPPDLFATSDPFPTLPRDKTTRNTGLWGMLGVQTASTLVGCTSSWLVRVTKLPDCSRRGRGPLDPKHLCL